MKQSELRIGSIYKSVKWNKPVRLTAEDISELVYRADGASIEHYIGEIFEPIPLTEEWLLKFGFKTDKNRSYYYKSADEYELRIAINAFSGSLEREGSWFVSIITGYASQPVTLLKHYVHEIQDLYFAL